MIRKSSLSAIERGTDEAESCGADPVQVSIQNCERFLQDLSVNASRKNSAHTENDGAVPVPLLPFESTPSFILGGTMKDYQLEGLNWLLELYHDGRSGILADEMGLGKTVQTIALFGTLKHERGITLPHLIVAPLSTISNWEKEIARWCPSLRVLVLHGVTKQRLGIVRHLNDPDRRWDICLTSFEIACAEKKSLKKQSWCYLVVDEAHRMKNQGSLLSRSLREMSSHCRLLLTAVPLQDNVRDLGVLFSFLMPHMCNSIDDFVRVFSRLATDPLAVVKLQSFLKVFMLRRLKRNVEKAIPPKRRMTIDVALTEMQRKWYRKILRNSVDKKASIDNRGENDTRRRNESLNLLMQLRKCCNHPYLLSQTESHSSLNEAEHLIENSGKMIVLDKMLRKLKESGSRILLLTQMTRMMDILEDYLRYRQYRYRRIDGTTSSRERETLVTEFNAPGSLDFIFLLTTRAGGSGLRFPTADVVIHYDSDMNPHIDLMAQSRVHFVGQEKAVRVFTFTTKNSVEAMIAERAEAKLKSDGTVLPTQDEDHSGELQRLMELAINDDGWDKDEYTDEYTDEDIDMIVDGKDVQRMTRVSEPISAPSQLKTYPCRATMATMQQQIEPEEPVIPSPLLQIEQQTRNVMSEANKKWSEKEGARGASSTLFGENSLRMKEGEANVEPPEERAIHNNKFAELAAALYAAEQESRRKVQERAYMQQERSSTQKHGVGGREMGKDGSKHAVRNAEGILDLQSKVDQLSLNEAEREVGARTGSSIFSIFWCVSLVSSFNLL